jgi:hypothetical protein
MPPPYERHSFADEASVMTDAVFRDMLGKILSLSIYSWPGRYTGRLTHLDHEYVTLDDVSARDFRGMYVLPPVHGLQAKVPIREIRSFSLGR